MKSSQRVLCLGSAAMALAISATNDLAFSQRPVFFTPPAAHKPLVQIGVLLDTSNSMDGLIAQAKSQLWKIVNQFIKAKKDGIAPEVQVALYEYGKSSIPAAEGYLRMIVPFTTDLDKVSEELFALTTNGGEEYCGRVIQAAVSGLKWSESSETLKTIFIAGNEPFTQGDVDFRAACQWAISKGIAVNTIFCGNLDEGVRTNWKDGALLGEGSFMNIDSNAALAQIDTPQDKALAELGIKINVTYIPYGAQGRVYAARQSAQDSNASSLSADSMAERASCKGSANYQNAGWDLVDAIRNKICKLEEVKDDQLPEDMRKLSLAERKAFLEGKMREREQIQAAIQRLSEERARFLAEEMKKRGSEINNTLDAAVIKIVREQAQKKGYKFE